jgi:hypothetical protein
VKQEAINGATNPRVDARNAVAKALAETEGIPTMEHHLNRRLGLFSIKPGRQSWMIKPLRSRSFVKYSMLRQSDLWSQTNNPGLEDADSDRKVSLRNRQSTPYERPKGAFGLHVFLTSPQ